MEKCNKISVIINTYNAEEYLEEVLTAVSQFDEIIICDMESTDATMSIAQKHGCRIVTFPKGNNNIVEPAREFAIHQASYKWVLVVDADEIVTPELREYLYERIKDPDCPNGLYIPRINKRIGRFMKQYSCDHQLRFLVEKETYWPPVIHAIPKVNGRVERIPKNNRNINFLHLDDKPLTDIFAKRNIYSDYEVKKKAHKKYGAFALVWRPFWRGFKTYFLEGNFRNGIRGLISAGNAAFYQFMIVAKVIEKRLREEDDKTL